MLLCGTTLSNLFTLVTVFWLITWGCNSVLVRGLVVAKGHEHRLDGANENSSQAAIEDYIKDEDFNCKKKMKSKLVMGVNIVKLVVAFLINTITDECEEERLLKND